VGILDRIAAFFGFGKRASFPGGDVSANVRRRAETISPVQWRMLRRACFAARTGGELVRSSIEGHTQFEGFCGVGQTPQIDLQAKNVPRSIG
jgi:hypothetical protein